jgi:hypothetical protein
MAPPHWRWRRHVDSLGEEDEALIVDLASFDWD